MATILNFHVGFQISTKNKNLVEDHPVNISGKFGWEFHIFIFFSETSKQILTKLGRNVHWMVIYKIFVFGVDRKSNMAARAHNVF
jgi:hypothetical protein